MYYERMMNPRSSKSIINQFSRRLFWISSSSDIGEYDSQAIGLIFRYSKLDQLKNSRLFPEYSFKSSFEYSFVIILSSRCPCHSCGACSNVVKINHSSIRRSIMFLFVLYYRDYTLYTDFNTINKQRVSFHSSNHFYTDTPRITLLTPLFFLPQHHSLFPFHCHTSISQ